MVFFSARQWNIRALKQIIFVMFFALFIGEYLVFLITAFIWNVPVKSSEDDLKVLLISDPQIQVIYNSTFTCSSQYPGEYMGVFIGGGVPHFSIKLIL